MLSLWFGKDPLSKRNPDSWFDHNFSYEWFDDEFAKEMLSDVECTIYNEEYKFTNWFNNNYTVRSIGGGIKTILLMKNFYREGLYFNLVCCGQNLSKYLARLSVDSGDRIIRCTLSGPYLDFDGMDFNIYCENDGTMIKDDEDFNRKHLKFLNSERNTEFYKYISKGDYV